MDGKTHDIVFSASATQATPSVAMLQNRLHVISVVARFTVALVLHDLKHLPFSRHGLN